jgi:hypothetical protein
MPLAKITQHAVATFFQADDPPVRVTQDAVLVFKSRPTPSPTTVTGAGVTQSIVLAFMSLDTPAAHVTQDVALVFMSVAGAIGIGGTGEGGQKAYGGAT